MKLHKMLPHLNLVLSLMMLVLIVFDSINPMMSFLHGDVFEIALTCLVAVGLLSSIASIVHNARCKNENK